MASQKDMESIYRDVAEHINNIAIVNGVNTLYDVFCNSLQLVKYINMNDIQCSDISAVKIDILNAYKNNDVSGIKNIVTNILNRVTGYKDTDIEDTELNHMMEVLNSIYGEIEALNLDMKSFEEILNDNLKIRDEHCDKNKVKKLLCSGVVTLTCKDFYDTDIKDNSIVIAFAPFRKSNILQDKFNHKQYNDWLNQLVKRENITILVLSREELGDNFKLIEEYQKDKKKNRLKLYININDWYKIYGDDILDEF